MKKDTEVLEFAKECIAESKQLFYENKITESEKVAARARDIALEQDAPQIYAQAMNMLYILYGAMDDYTRAIDCFIKNEEVCLKHGFHTELSILYINIGSRFKSFDDSKTASLYFEKALAERKKVDKKNDSVVSSQFELVMSMNLGELYAEAGQMDKAEEQLNIARSEVKKFTEHRILFGFESFEMLQLYKLGHLDEVKSGIDHLVESAIKSGFSADYIECIHDVCTLLKNMKEYDKWKKVLDRLRDFATREHFSMHIEMHEQLMDYYKTIGEEKKYMEECIKYTQHMIEKKKIDNRHSAENMRLMLESYEAEKDRKKATENLHVDTLTGVGTRIKMLEDSVGYIKESAEKGTAITVGLLDVDYFKSCNDTYGHIRGDECLKSIASVLQNSVAGNGFVYRFGGDEFLVFMPGLSDVNKLEKIAQTIQDRVEALDIANENSPVAKHVTISQGYTMGVADKNDNITTLIDLADKVLYKAKDCGRNNHKFMRIREILAES
ncbi:MAG: GGDEF domain-containing protein [Lachnospiraceae bacterium]|nr:GGDEF domain-containing protein [Lachnospiraceae bacterium]